MGAKGEESLPGGEEVSRFFSLFSIINIDWY